MHSLYQFGFKLYEDTNKWEEQISNLFEINFKINKIVDEYPNIEKNWIESVEPSLRDLKGFNLLHEYVERVHASFNRYQSYVYLTVVFTGDITSNVLFIEELRHRFESNVLGFIDSFAIPFKESGGETENSKYNEFLEFQNPVLVTDALNNDTYLKATVKSGELYYKFNYKQQNKDKYTRRFEQVYISDSINLRVLDHFHSMFVVFHRTVEFYKELSSMDNVRMILFEMSDALNRIWPTERMKLFMLHRIWNANLYNKTFFSVLELTAQMDTLINQLVVRNQTIFDKYEKQYERVFHNFDIENLENDKIYKDLIKYLMLPYNYRKHAIDNIRSLYEPTDEQICRLRSDNDSRVNSAIQSIMSILSIVFFVWGVLSAWYQTAISNTATITEKLLFNSHYWPATFSIIAFGTALASIIIALIISSRNSKTFTKEVQDVIENKEMDIRAVQFKIEKIKSCKHKKYRLLLITELFNIFTVFLTINSNDKKLEVYRDEILEIIKIVDRC